MWRNFGDHKTNVCNAGYGKESSAISMNLPLHACLDASSSDAQSSFIVFRNAVVLDAPTQMRKLCTLLNRNW